MRVVSSSVQWWPTNSGLGFVPIRKKGKLPFTTVEETYELEYGSATVELHTDAVKAGDRVLLIDDLIATGGTMMAGAPPARKARRRSDRGRRHRRPTRAGRLTTAQGLRACPCSPSWIFQGTEPAPARSPLAHA